MTPRERFAADATEYERLARGSRFPFDPANVHPCLDDREASPLCDPHYFHGDCWAAQKIIDRRPMRHVDMGSRFDGLVSHLLAARVPVEHVDVRKLELDVDGLKFTQDDATMMASFASASVASLSSIHAVEHVGLGRYGDTICPDAWIAVCVAFERIMARGAVLYFGVPIGRERVAFNAHRVFAPSTIRDRFAVLGLTLASFSAVDDAGAFVREAAGIDWSTSSYSLGLFEFRKG